jgi:hypothetical protein
MKDLKAKVENFFDQFSSTGELVGDLIRSKSNPQEILILLCSRIDALASNSAREDEPRQKAFTRFVTVYSGKSRTFESISIGDLYYELDYHLWLLPGMLEKAGRIQTFSRLNEPILKLLVDSEIALTSDEAKHLLERIRWALHRHFRPTPGQPLKKSPLASAREVTEAVLDEFRRARTSASKSALPKALDPLISSKTLARILYEKFRCEVIHGGKVFIDEQRFFAEREPYWKPLYSEFYGPFQLIEFPAQFLTSLFSDCIRNYKKRLESTRKLPPGIHFEIFGDDIFSSLDVLDESLLPRGRVAFPK